MARLKSRIDRLTAAAETGPPRGDKIYPRWSFLGLLFDYGRMAARWCQYLYEQGRYDDLKKFIADQNMKNFPHVRQPDQAQLNWAVWALGREIREEKSLWWWERGYETPHYHVMAIIDLLTEQEREAIAAAEAGKPGGPGWESANEKVFALGGIENLVLIEAGAQEAF